MSLVPSSDMRDNSHGTRAPADLLALALLVLTVGILAETPTAAAAVTAYNDEATYLADAAGLGYCVVIESFESDAAWGAARSPNKLPSVTTLGSTWLPNNDTSQITTGSGPARTGLWGFYELPHGDFINGIADGWIGRTAKTFFGVGGWIKTNTPPAEIDMLLDDTTVVDFDPSVVGTQHAFFGVIETDGFVKWELRELDGKIGDQKFIFADDFSIAFDEPCGPVVFADDFESGDVSAWSSSMP